jgi:hypothetical protein
MCDLIRTKGAATLDPRSRTALTKLLLTVA